MQNKTEFKENLIHSQSENVSSTSLDTDKMKLSKDANNMNGEELNCKINKLVLRKIGKTLHP